MSETVADHLLQRLAGEWGVRRIYGYPGDGINGIMGAFGCPRSATAARRVAKARFVSKSPSSAAPTQLPPSGGWGD